MKSRNGILLAHYNRLLQRAAVWLGMGAILSTMFLPMGALALGTQMGARSVTPTTLKAAATGTSYAITFKPSATNSGATMGSLQIEICDSPLESVACVASGTSSVNSNGADASAASFTSMSGTGCTGGTWAAAAAVTPGPGVNGTARRLTNSGTAVAPTTSNACTLTWGGIKNPIGNNQHFYLRLTTYSTTSYTTELDFGGFALQTAQDLTINASVQESLTFCVGDVVTTNCASAGSGTISLGTGTGCPVLSTANNCTGTSMFAVATNAATGYSVTYNGTTFAGPSDTITAIGGTIASSTINTKQFGLAGTTKSGGSGLWNTSGTNYDFGTNGSKYAYVTGSPQVVAAFTGPSAETDFTVTYLANVDSTTKPGQYVATINYVCTGLF